MVAQDRTVMAEFLELVEQYPDRHNVLYQLSS
jgi:hypothetical protein